MMLRRRGAATALAGGAALLALTVSGAPASATQVHAAAAPAGAVPFAQANFSGYGTGTAVHTGVLSATTTAGSPATQAAAVDQAFSGASTAFGGAGNNVGLTSTINSELGTVVSPSSLGGGVNAYGNGVGLQVGLGTSNPATTNASQVQLAGLATQQAPPNAAPVISQEAVPSSIPATVASGGALKGEAAAFFDPTGCPLGQPISYGVGQATNLSALDLGGITNSTQLSGGGTLQLVGGSGNGTAESASLTYLNSNGDGSFGLATQANETIAPLTVNIGGQLTLKVDVVTAAGGDAPVALTAVTTGEASGASVKFSSAGIVNVTLSVAGGAPTTLLSVPLADIGPSGLHVPLSISGLNTALSTLQSTVTSAAGSLPAVGGAAGPALNTVLTTLNPLVSTVTGTLNTVLSQVPANISLGSLDIDVTPHAIGQSATTPATVTGGTKAAGALDLLKLDVAPTATVAGTSLPVAVDLANVALGHLEASATNASPILCPLPIIKSVDQQSITAGQSFTYTIQVPDPAKIADLACDLTAITATDTITDYKGKPLFSVTGASNGGTFTNTPSQTSSTINWTGLEYKRAAPGAPATPPVTLTVSVSTPSNSPAGTIQDVVTANGTAANCKDSVSGIANLGNVNGVVLAGSYTLQAPEVTTSAAPAPTPTTTPPQALPYTGGTGGLWQPLAGLGALGLGGGVVWALRRSRRLTS